MRLDPRQVPSRLSRLVKDHPRPVIGAALAGAVVVSLGVSLLMTSSSQPPAAPQAQAPTFTYAQTWTLLELQRHADSGEIVAITAPSGATADSTFLVARTKDGQLVQVALTATPADAVSALTSLGYGRLLTAETATAGLTPSSGSDTMRFLLAWLLPMLLVGIAVAVVLRMGGRGRGRSDGTGTLFGANRAADSRRPRTAGTSKDPAAERLPNPATGDVLLADVAGCDEAKLELTETIEFLKTPERFHELGARSPRGIMLYGPPGTGKTMLARAVAAEASVPFYYASGSDFVEKYVGVGARRIRDLFARARKAGRGVIFLDEFDALGKARGGQNSHEEREQTLNQLLVELDGFGTTDDIVVIAATNRIDVLDPAVLRPGRFNRKIHVGLPDVVGRAEILRVHARNKPISAAADLTALARKTYGFSGAMLADLLNEAAIFTARRGGAEVTPEDLHSGWLKVAVGTSRHRSMEERERSIIAAHEVGHAICGRVHGDRRRVEEISLFAHGEALGVTVSSQEDNDLPSESDLRAHLVALMGGRAAEEILFQDVTGGASDDFEKANQIASTMVTRWGMGFDPESVENGISGRGSLSFLVAGPGDSLPVEVQPAATRAIRAILDGAYAQACATLIEQMDVLRRIAAYLVEHERIDGDTFDALYAGTQPIDDFLAEWRPETARPRPWAEMRGFVDQRRPVPATPSATEAPAAPARPDPVAAHGPNPRPVPNAAVETPPVNAGAGGAGRRERGLLGRLRPGRPRPALAPSSVVAPAAVALPATMAVPANPSRPKRRVRAAAVGFLRRAETWLVPSEVDADRH